MRPLRPVLLLLLPPLVAAGCGDSHRSPPASDGGVTRIDGGPGVDSGGDTDGGGATGSGDCEIDADCPGGTCIELTPAGYRVCNVAPAEATECTGATIDECCSTAECASGACYLGPVAPFCGGPGTIPHNVCAEDGCAGAADCPDSTICVPGGSLGRIVASCVFAACATDADCTAEAGGACLTVTDPCCGVQSLACVYPGGCRSNVDCPGGACVLEDSRMICSSMPPPCPA